MSLFLAYSCLCALTVSGVFVSSFPVFSFFFFFSSRRRHTRFDCDWSSDVCSPISNLNSAEANLQRLVQLQVYERVVAPFAGVITARNVDPGALVGTAGGVSGTSPAGSGSAPGSLFTIAQADTLSVYVTVPEGYAAAVAIGKPAVVTLPALPGDTLRGRVARTAGSLDATARTLLAEGRVANPKSAFLPGM